MYRFFFLVTTSVMEYLVQMSRNISYECQGISRTLKIKCGPPKKKKNNLHVALKTILCNDWPKKNIPSDSPTIIWWHVQTYFFSYVFYLTLLHVTSLVSRTKTLKSSICRLFSLIQMMWLDIYLNSTCACVVNGVKCQAWRALDCNIYVLYGCVTWRT